MEGSRVERDRDGLQTHHIPTVTKGEAVPRQTVSQKQNMWWKARDLDGQK
jgi:hypothetical protein